MANPLGRILAALAQGGTAQPMPQVGMAGGMMDVNDQPLPGIVNQQVPQVRRGASGLPKVDNPAMRGPQMQDSGAVQPASIAAPNPGRRTGGLGEMLGSLLMPNLTGRNKTIDWLQGLGLDEGTASFIARDKATLNGFIRDHLRGPDPMKQLQMQKLQKELVDDGKPWWVRDDGSVDPAKLEASKASATSINLNKDGELFSGLPKDVRKVMFERQTMAQDAADLIRITKRGLSLLDSDAGAITGAGANMKIAAVKWAQTLGVPVDPQAADNSEAFKAVMGLAVGKIIKQFGAGTGLSDADREYAQQIVGGNIELNEASIRRIFTLADKAARAQIKNYNATREKVLGGDLGALLGVDEPPESKQLPGGKTGGGVELKVLD